MQQMDLIGSDMGDIKKMADAVVDAILKGGSVYYYSRYYVGLATEALGRRGGLALNRTDWEGNKNFKASPKNVVIMGLCTPDDPIDLKHLDVYKRSGMRVFSIGPSTRYGNVPAGRTVPKETSIHVGRLRNLWPLRHSRIQPAGLPHLRPGDEPDLLGASDGSRRGHHTPHRQRPRCVLLRRGRGRQRAQRAHPSALRQTGILRKYEV